MKYLVLKNGSVKYKLSTDKLFIRLGIWDFTDISIDKDSFSNKNSSFDVFINKFIRILDGKRVNLEDFSDSYEKELINELISNNLLIKIVDTNDINEENNICIISDKQSIEFMKNYNRVMGINNVSFKNISTEFNVTNENRYIVIAPTPYISNLKAINEKFFQKSITWSMAIQDNLFMHFSTFVPTKTACFNCFNVGNSMRMYDYENYVNYLKTEEQLTKSPYSEKTSICYLYQTALMYESESFYPLEGQLLSIYIPHFEYNIEPLQKSTLCDLDGFKAMKISEDLNLNAQSIIDSLISKGSNDD